MVVARLPKVGVGEAVAREERTTGRIAWVNFMMAVEKEVLRLSQKGLSK